MNRTASGRSIVAILVAMLVALGYTSQALHAKKPPKPDPKPLRPVLYQVTWIPGGSTAVSDVNAFGQFVGSVRALDEPDTFPIYGFVDNSGNPQHWYLNDLLPSDLTAYGAIGINDDGLIVGQCKSEEGFRRVFAYDSETGVVEVMNVPPVFEEYRQRAIRLAEDGTVVGYIDVPDVGQLGFIWIPGTVAEVLLSPDFGTVTGINKQGDIVGNQKGMFYSALPYEEAVLLGQSAAIGFGFAINTATGPDVNDEGTIVGTPAPDSITTDLFSSVVAVDLDGDGDQDVLTATGGHSGEIAWYENEDGQGPLGNFGSRQVIATGQPQGVHAADMDGDDDLDIISRFATKVVWQENLLAHPGDANRDGQFDSSDLVEVFQRGEYEDGIAGNSTWQEGDWNDDGEFDSGDLVAAFQKGLYERKSPVGASEIAAAVDWLFAMEEELEKPAAYVA